MKTINTKRVGDSFVPDDGDDLDPYSEYVHEKQVNEVQQDSHDVAAPAKQYNREEVMKNFNEFIEGVDVMTTMFTEILKRFR